MRPKENGPRAGQPGAPFITVEGGEGTGKTLFTANLHRVLVERGHSVLVTREPGGTPIAEKMRELFNYPIETEVFTPEAEFLLLSAARAQHVQHKVIPALTSKQWVLCDRYVDSSRLYQGILGGLDRNFIEMVIQRTTFGVQPTVTLLLDCPVPIARERLKDRQIPLTRFDRAAPDLHEKIRAGYLQLQAVEPKRIFIVDASRTPEETLVNALAALYECQVLKNKPKKLV